VLTADGATGGSSGYDELQGIFPGVLAKRTDDLTNCPFIDLAGWSLTLTSPKQLGEVLVEPLRFTVFSGRLRPVPRLVLRSWSS